MSTFFPTADVHAQELPPTVLAKPQSPVLHATRILLLMKAHISRLVFELL